LVSAAERVIAEVVGRREVDLDANAVDEQVVLAGVVLARPNLPLNSCSNCSVWSTASCLDRRNIALSRCRTRCGSG